MQTCASRETPPHAHLPAASFRLFARLALGVLIAVNLQCSAGAASSESRQIESDGVMRTYWQHIPDHLPGKPVPLVLIFHGSGSDGASMEDFTKFSTLADHHGFIAVYPDAVAANWNDGRAVPGILSQAKNVDDVAFTSAIIEAVSKEHALDPKRIYATGFSNGGIFVYLLAEKLTSRFAAIASVSGGIAEPVAPDYKPSMPLSVFIVHGTKDPLVPYVGGEVDYSHNGRIISTEDTVKKWITINGIEDRERTGELPDLDPSDHSRVKWTRWTFPKTKTELLLYTVVGAGHTWPSGPQFLPISTIGEVDRDFDGATAIWEFFEKHPKP